MTKGPTDLTRPDWIKNAHPNDGGTAIYWVLDQSGNYEQLFAPNVTHARAVEMANQLSTMSAGSVDAYRWVPDQVEDASSLVKSVCGGRCTRDLDCVNNACRCIQGHCRRK